MSNNIINHFKDGFYKITREDPDQNPKDFKEKLSDGLLLVPRKAFGHVIHLNKDHSSYTWPTISKVTRVINIIVFVAASLILVPITFVGVLIASISKSRDDVLTAIKAQKLINIEDLLNKPGKEKAINLLFFIKEFFANKSPEEIQNFAKEVKVEEDKKCKSSKLVESAYTSVLIEAASKEHISDIVKGSLLDEKNKDKKIGKILLLLTTTRRDLYKLNEVFDSISPEDFKTALATLSNEEIRELMLDVPVKFIPVLLQDLNTRKDSDIDLDKESNKTQGELLPNYLAGLFTDKNQLLKLEAALPYITADMYEKLFTSENIKKKTKTSEYFSTISRIPRLDILFAVIAIPKDKLPEGVAQKCKESICKEEIISGYGSLGTPIETIVSIATQVPTHPRLPQVLLDLRQGHFASAEKYTKLFTALFNHSIDDFSSEEFESFLIDLHYHHANENGLFSFLSEGVKEVMNELKEKSKERGDLISKFLDKADLNKLSPKSVLLILDILSHYGINAKHTLIATMSPEKMKECLNEMFKKEQSYIEKRNSNFDSKNEIEKKNLRIQNYEERLRDSRHCIQFLFDQLDFVNSKENAEKIQAQIYEMLTDEQYEQLCDHVLDKSLGFIGRSSGNSEKIIFDSFYVFATQGLPEEKSAQLINSVIQLIKKYQSKNKSENKGYSEYGDKNEKILKNILNQMIIRATPNQTLKIIDLIFDNSLEWNENQNLEKIFVDTDTKKLELLVKEWKPFRIAQYLNRWSFAKNSKHQGLLEELKKQGKYEDILKLIELNYDIFSALTDEEKMMLIKHYTANKDNHNSHSQFFSISNDLTSCFVNGHGFNEIEAKKFRKELIEFLQTVAGYSKEAFNSAFRGVISRYNSTISYYNDIDKLDKAKDKFKPALTDILDLISELNKNQDCKAAISEFLIPAIVQNLIAMSLQNFIVYKSSSVTEIILALKFHSWEKDIDLWQGDKLGTFLENINGGSGVSVSLPLIFDHMSDLQKKAVTIEYNLKIYSKKMNNQDIRFDIKTLNAIGSNLEAADLTELMHNNWEELNKQPNFSDQLKPFLMGLVSEGHLDILKFFHDKGIDLKFQTKEGLSLLHAARGDQKIIDYLIQTVGVDEKLRTTTDIKIQLGDNDRLPSIKIFKDVDYKEYAKQLLNEGAARYAQFWLENGYNEERALKIMPKQFKGVNFKSFKDCLDHIADKNMKLDKRGNTLFHFAMMNLEEIPIEIIKQLVEHGTEGTRVNSDLENSQGKTPLQLADESIKEWEESEEKDLNKIQEANKWLADYRYNQPTIIYNYLKVTNNVKN